MIRLDKQAHFRLALSGQEAHVHHDRRLHELLGRHPVAGLVAQRTAERQIIGRRRDEVGWRVEVGTAVLVYNDQVGLVGVRASDAPSRPLDLGELVPVVVCVVHVPWPRPRQPLRERD